MFVFQYVTARSAVHYIIGTPGLCVDVCVRLCVCVHVGMRRGWGRVDDSLRYFELVRA